MYKAAALILLGIALAFPQRSRYKPTDELEMDRQELVNLEKEAARATQLNDPTFFKRVLEDEYYGVLATGQKVDKPRMVELMQYAKLNFASVRALDIRVRIYGDGAVVTALWEKRSAMNGKLVIVRERVMHIFSDSAHGWKMVAGQETNTSEQPEQK